jgi:hypothetical protein
MTPDEKHATEAIAGLRSAWDDMLGELARARDAIDRPELMPAPPNDRNLAEGYRYLMGYVHSAVERAFFEDPQFPFFHHAIELVNKATIDNADATYFMAPIDGHQSYLIRGRVGDHRHWRGEAPSASGPKAPQYLIFEVTDGCMAGDTGTLAELRPGIKAQTGRLDSTEIEVTGDGSFEILLAPQRPDGHTGNFIATHRRTSRPNPDDPEGSLDRYACTVSGRQLFYDWEREDPIPLTITGLETSGSHPPPYTPETAMAQIRRFGSLVRGQMQFWNEFYTVLLETYGKPGGEADGEESQRFMPRNSFNQPNAATGATGGGQSTNIYAGGVFELAPDEALIIESHVKVKPEYSGFSLSNLWGESLDFANHQSSLNGFQAEADRDEHGAITRYVVADRDPGVPNWLDTTDHREGFLSPRWSYSRQPPEELWPTISAKKVRFDEIRDHLPAATRTVSPAERAERIRVRQLHVQRRYRAF